MSTTKISESLRLLDRLSDEASELVLDAETELAAIREAAKALKKWNDNGQPHLDPDAARAWSVIESIAREAP